MTPLLTALLTLLQANDCTVDGAIVGVYNANTRTWSADTADGAQLAGTFDAGDIRGEPAVGYRWGGYNSGQFGASYGSGFALGEWRRAAGRLGTIEGVHGTCPSRDPRDFDSWYPEAWRISSTVVGLYGQSNAVGRGGNPPRHDVAGELFVNGVNRPSYAGPVSVETLADDPSITVLKRARGGSTIEEWQEPGGYGDLAIADVERVEVRPLSVVWLHGGSAALGAAVEPPTYKHDVSALFDRWEAAWGPQLFLDAHLSETTATRIALNVLKDELAGERDDVVLVDMTGITYKGDGIHIDRPGLNELAVRIRDVLDYRREVWVP